MARSSGGGSRSGGSHSGGSSRSSSRSSGSSSSSRRVSDNPFHGCRTFRYTRNGVHHYVYSNTDLRNIPDAKPRWFLIFFYIPFAFSIIAMLFSGFHPIEKPLNTLDYENVLVIDEAEIFIQSEETALLGTLRKFSETTGITTQIVTVPRERWMNYTSFEDYAYDRYYEQFDNENSWLLLYSEYDNGCELPMTKVTGF